MEIKRSFTKAIATASVLACAVLYSTASLAGVPPVYVPLNVFVNNPKNIQGIHYMGSGPYIAPNVQPAGVNLKSQSSDKFTFSAWLYELNPGTDNYINGAFWLQIGVDQDHSCTLYVYANKGSLINQPGFLTYIQQPQCSLGWSATGVYDVYNITIILKN